MGPLSCDDDELKKDLWGFVIFAHESGYDIKIVSEEKTGRFKEHLRLIESHIPENTHHPRRQLYP